MTNNIERFKAITKEMAELYERKNNDYGDSFGQSCNKHGLIAAVVRMEDKLNRAATLINKDTMVKSESIKDTLTDLANYAIMARMWLEWREGEECCGDVEVDRSTPAALYALMLEEKNRRKENKDDITQKVLDNYDKDAVDGGMVFHNFCLDCKYKKYCVRHGRHPLCSLIFK